MGSSAEPPHVLQRRAASDLESEKTLENLKFEVDNSRKREHMSTGAGRRCLVVGERRLDEVFIAAPPTLCVDA